MEAALRTAYEIVTGRELPLANLHVAAVAGLNGVKEASLKIEGTMPEWKFLEGVTLNVAVAHGLGNAQRVIAAIRSGQKQYHFVEVMTCPGGCIGGGGQPRYTEQPGPPGPHRRHLPRGRGQEAPQVAREPRRRAALRRVPRPAAGREVAPPAAHAVHAAPAGVAVFPRQMLLTCGRKGGIISSYGETYYCNGRSIHARVDGNYQGSGG